ncbi:hypothetical protein [Massilia endophytica]|uniref:hypothetical protein n=1 Tax=Massilia endophytica TaxID=2899220 RepID=UPI001E512173|nr:hypothetical protein [Massilia endophytica]UGQ44944.1 hypothetical protein LSQ66_14170 [Massilia endophytica]
MRYIVNIDFKKGPSFGTDVEADDRFKAESMALREARRYGFEDAPKKVTVTPLHPETSHA